MLFLSSAVHYLCTEATCYLHASATFSQSTFTPAPTHVDRGQSPVQKAKAAHEEILCFWIPFMVTAFSQSLGGLLGSLGVALHTQDSAVQRVTAIFVGLYGERASAVLRNEGGSAVRGEFKRWVGVRLR